MGTLGPNALMLSLTRCHGDHNTLKSSSFATLPLKSWSQIYSFKVLAALFYVAFSLSSLLYAQLRPSVRARYGFDAVPDAHGVGPVLTSPR